MNFAELICFVPKLDADREKSLELRERPKKGKAQEVELESKWEIKKNPFRADAIFQLQWPDKE